VPASRAQGSLASARASQHIRLVLTFAPLFRGSLVSITDVVCRASDSRCGAEEQASSHHLLFTRSGVFVKHAGGRQLVAEAAHVLFFNRDEPYRVSHPVPGGDDCTVVSFGADTLADVLAIHRGAGG
jgi:hypothetical protein